jgi:hypothetical protein
VVDLEKEIRRHEDRLGKLRKLLAEVKAEQARASASTALGKKALQNDAGPHEP